MKQPRTSRTETLLRLLARVSPSPRTQRTLTPSQTFALKRLAFIARYV